jgi:hypothetical protein
MIHQFNLRYCIGNLSIYYLLSELMLIHVRQLLKSRQSQFPATASAKKASTFFQKQLKVAVSRFSLRIKKRFFQGILSVGSTHRWVTDTGMHLPGTAPDQSLEDTTTPPPPLISSVHDQQTACNESVAWGW